MSIVCIDYTEIDVNSKLVSASEALLPTLKLKPPPFVSLFQDKNLYWALTNYSKGSIKFHEFIGDKWVVLFSHPEGTNTPFRFMFYSIADD